VASSHKVLDRSLMPNSCIPVHSKPQGGSRNAQPPVRTGLRHTPSSVQSPSMMSRRDNPTLLVHVFAFRAFTTTAACHGTSLRFKSRPHATGYSHLLQRIRRISRAAPWAGMVDAKTTIIRLELKTPLCQLFKLYVAARESAASISLYCGSSGDTTNFFPERRTN
jgi:hypothetical protein